MSVHNDKEKKKSESIIEKAVKLIFGTGMVDKAAKKMSMSARKRREKAAGL